ncbi:hypothetical protein CWR53_10655 [Pseudomonas sp. SGAir0191]|nr:hypothetical protein CWR53_10655 [Pseudomonas sp. SGAir0191]
MGDRYRPKAAIEFCSLLVGTGLSREHGRSPCQTTPFDGPANSRAKPAPTKSCGIVCTLNSRCGAPVR